MIGKPPGGTQTDIRIPANDLTALRIVDVRFTVVGNEAGSGGINGYSHGHKEDSFFSCYIY